MSENKLYFGNYEGPLQEVKNYVPAKEPVKPYFERVYKYLGDRYTDPELRGKICKAVMVAGKCVRGANGNMLVTFQGVKVNVIARLLRKIV